MRIITYLCPKCYGRITEYRFYSNGELTPQTRRRLKDGKYCRYCGFDIAAKIKAFKDSDYIKPFQD